MAISVPIAHAGHYLLWVVYLVPVVVVIWVAVISLIQQRRERRGTDDAGGPGKAEP